MRIEERTSNAKSFVDSAMVYVGVAHKQWDITRDVYSTVTEKLDDAKQSLYKAEDKCIRTDKRRRHRQHAVYELMEAHAILTNGNYCSDSRNRIQEAIFSLIV